MGAGLFVGSGAIKTDAVGQGHMQPAEASHRTGPDYIAGSRGQYVTEPLADAPAVMPLSDVK